MLFFKQFEAFDPLSGYVPEYPFSCLPEIAGRARSILNGKTHLQLVGAAKRIDEEIERHLEYLKYVAVSDLKIKLQAEGSLETYFEWTGGDWDDGGGDECWKFNDDLVDDLEIPTDSNCNEVDALKTIIEDRDCCFFLPEGAPEPEPDEYPEGKTHELFAVLALWLLADAIEWADSRGRNHLPIAARYAVKAMDAVCYAEHLREIEWYKTYLKKQSGAELTDALRRQHEDHQKAAKQARSERAKELNKFRHAPKNHAKEVVTAEWAKNTSQFASADKAGNHYADWLESMGIVKSIEPRTVTGWIRDRAKELGVKFR